MTKLLSLLNNEGGWVATRMRKQYAASPMFIQQVQSVFNTNTSPKTTAAIDVLANDTLVAFAISSESSGITQTISGGSLTWTRQILVSTASFCQISVWTATVDTNKNMTITVTNTGGSSYFGTCLLNFRNTGGIGATASTHVASGAPTVNITTTKANSAVVVVNGDWNAGSGARTWRTNAGPLTEVVYVFTSGQYTSYGGYHPNAGPTGTYAVGLSAPTGQAYSIAALEIKGP